MIVRQAPNRYALLNVAISEIKPPVSIPIPSPISHEVRYVLVAVPRWLLGARFTNRVLYAGNMVPNPIPKSSEMIKKA